ncbi:hypothetical protein NECAME_16801 [Necator americanus]|uniref:Uncharacterized protein n=1 Tax=Necator americanus TaxID=51031 RepID=W2TWC6_NECAM|nr:hypothetical protein NECAME_16801 [Necator americanus]ETN85361.1 hypothetical protein NECAME_16801 [Necator americanus]
MSEKFNPSQGKNEEILKDVPHSSILRKNTYLVLRSLFLRRKFLSTAAVSSLDSTNSTESSAPEAIFASSVDSAGSDLEHRRLSLMNRLPTGSAPHLMSRQAPSSANPPANTQRRRFRNRDYSVDAQSDSLFREWSRVDPAYEERDTRDHRDQREPRRRLERGASEDQSASRLAV